jgi:hypothetical protein
MARAQRATAHVIFLAEMGETFDGSGYEGSTILPKPVTTERLISVAAATIGSAAVQPQRR